MLLSWCSVLRVWMGWMQSFSLWVLEAVFWAGALNGVGSIRPSLARNVLQPSKQKRKFSSFFKSLVIELDKELYGPDNHLVEVRCAWLHPRKGEESCSVQWEVTLLLTLQVLRSPTQHQQGLLRASGWRGSCIQQSSAELSQEPHCCTL